LWVILLLTIITGSFALVARMDRLEANALLWGTQARMQAEAAIHLAVLSLRDPQEELRMIADGRLYETEVDGALLEVRATDERGKLDINAADELTLANLFSGHGMDFGEAELLAAAILDWRDEDDLERVNGAEEDAYLAAGMGIGPANRPFMMAEELLQVIGMQYEFFRKLEPGITVYSRAAEPDPAFAPVEALMALPDITYDEATDFVEQRQARQPGDDLGVELPNGIVVMEQGRGVTYSIEARATMPNGVQQQLQATIRLGGNNEGVPFQVLRWREGFH
ncbi:MAG: type II secretion system protein GspK, partial [Lysobacterales bacterium]